MGIDGNRLTQASRRTNVSPRKARAVWAAVTLAASLLLASCAGAQPETGARRGRGTTATAVPSVDPRSVKSPRHNLDSPPPVTVLFFDRSIELPAWAYCYGNACVDGAPPAKPPHVGNPGQVVVRFPLPGWSFTASFAPAGDECGRVQEAPLETTASGDFLLRPAGYSGKYDVTLYGRGGGSLVVTFRWTTSRDGPLPVPESRLAVLAGRGGPVLSYGVELEVANLAGTPREASARVTVRDAAGDAVTFKATRARRDWCFPEGTVYWDGPDDKGLAAAALGRGPFTYKVKLVLDGVPYRATATWPADEIVGNEPSVALDFRPELQALSSQA